MQLPVKMVSRQRIDTGFAQWVYRACVLNGEPEDPVSDENFEWEETKDMISFEKGDMHDNG